jgi:hypothetical protein
MHREVNTVLSKTGHLEVTRLGIAIKADIEKLREQVQNVEEYAAKQQLDHSFRPIRSGEVSTCLFRFGRLAGFAILDLLYHPAAA